MNELAKHIEVLLLENDCVIVPGLGGFIAHYRAASYNENNGTFCPPMRTIGFNPQLAMNDGLLVQSYMRTYNTDFPDATRRIEKTVCLLKDSLYKEGEITIGHIGVLYYSMNGIYEFEPAQEAFFTPSLYGLEKIGIPKLGESTDKTDVQKGTSATAHKHRSISPAWARNAAAIAATFLLFFLLPTQVQNTYTDSTDYASLGSEGLFCHIKSESMLSKCLSAEKSQAKAATANKHTAKPGAPIRPKAVRVEKVPCKKANESQTPVQANVRTQKTGSQSAKEEKPTAKSETYHVIVASLASEKDALAEVERMKQKGYTKAQVITSDNRFRISIGGYRTQAEAYKTTNEIHQKPGMESAWVYTAR